MTGSLAMREILATGYAAQPPPPVSSTGSRQGRHKQSQAKNLLDALLLRAEQVLALLDDLHIPFTNNQAERDLRWAKVQQKIAGTFRESGRGSVLFAVFAVIFRGCRSKDIPCCLV